MLTSNQSDHVTTPFDKHALGNSTSVDRGNHKDASKPNRSIGGESREKSRRSAAPTMSSAVTSGRAYGSDPQRGWRWQLGQWWFQFNFNMKNRIWQVIAPRINARVLPGMPNN